MLYIHTLPKCVMFYVLYLLQISTVVGQGTTDAAGDPTVFDDATCAMNDTEPFRVACLGHRIKPVVRTAATVAKQATEPAVENTNPCQWLRRLGSASDQIIQHLNFDCT